MYMTEPDFARLTVGMRLGWGVLLLSAPAAVMRAAGRPAPGRAPIAVARVLGARHIIQGALTVARPAPPVVRMGAAADALHALTGIALAVASRRWRKAASADTLVASCFAVAGWAAGASPGRPNGGERNAR